MKIIPISKELHRDWCYIGLPHYLHTQNDAIAPVVMAEISRLIVTNPIIFLDQDQLGLFSLQGLVPGRNLMIDKSGKWLGNYVPARYRSLPFILATDTGGKIGDDKLLCFISDLNCVAKEFKENSTKIFSDKAELSEDMSRVMKFLQSIDQNEQLTKKALLSIKNADILEDWTISLKLSDGEKKFSGLKKINIEKLKSLPGKILEDLNKTGALDICFASHFSLTNIEKLRNLVISQSVEKDKNQPESSIETLRDKTIKKQKEAKKEEMDNLVKNLLLDDEI